MGRTICPYCNGERLSHQPTCDTHRYLVTLVGMIPAHTYTGATIQAVDTDDDTFYVLREDGVPTATAPWPQMLEDLRPDARRIPSYGERHRQGFSVTIFTNRETDTYR